MENNAEQVLPRFVDEAFNESLSETLVYCKNKYEDPDMKGMHAHRGFEFHFAYSNKATIWVENNQYAAIPGQVFIIKPQTYHAVKVKQHTNYRRTILSVEENFLYSLQDQKQNMQSLINDLLNQCDPISLEITMQNKEMIYIQQLLLAMEREIEQKQQNYEWYVETLLTQIVILLGRTQQNKRVNENYSTEMREIVLSMMAYIADHCLENIDMSRLAQKFHISKSYMFKVFKAFTSYTPYQYLMLERVSQAKLLLQIDQMSITAVAAQTGFNDASHFIRTFKEIVGITPGAFKFNRNI